MHITLIGYRATGKTTLARLLAERLAVDWVDADVEIERVAGKPIRAIFDDDGEPAFRDIEAAVIADLCRRNNLVLAAGGGAPLREESRRAMKAAGKVVWLKASPETIHRRMTGDTTTPDRRPSLTDRGPLEEIEHLLQQRSPVYRDAADVEIDTEGISPEQLIEEILKTI